MDDVEHEPLDLHQPLEILRSTASRLMDRRIPATASRLDEIYAHLKGAVGDSLDRVSEHINHALQFTLENLPDEAPPDSEAAHTVEAAQHMLSAVQEELQQALNDIKESFFSASSFQECEANLPQLALFESRLEGGLLRLQQAVTMVDDPELFGPPTFEPAPSLSEALEAMALALEFVHVHLQDGDKQPLRQALEAVEKARLGLSAALAQE